HAMDVVRTDFKDTWLKARSNVLGFLIALTLLSTFIIDAGLPDGVSAWALYSIAIVLALSWDGARAIASVTATALVLTLIGLWIGPLGDFQTGIMNRAIGVVTITGLGLICLHVDRARRQLFQSCDALAASRRQLHSFVDEMNNTGVVLCDLRGRVTECNQGAQQLTGYETDDMKGRPLYRVFPGTMSPVTRWEQICHWARRKGEVAWEEVLRRRDGSWCLMHMMVKPLQNRFRRHHGYSIVMHNLTKSPSMVKGRSSKSRPVSSVLRDNRDVLLYRCHFEPRRTLDYIDAKNTHLLDDSAGGFPSEQGQALGDWIHPLDRESAWNAIEEAVRAQRSYLLVYRLIGTEGTDKWVWDEGEAFKTDDGRIAGLEGFLAGM
ncbi:MAG TPA: PAS domain-containing protein, partial [Nitrospira sp.]|nr:PAS domain-containing protein [Nitrospira sp.]